MLCAKILIGGAAALALCKLAAADAAAPQPGTVVGAAQIGSMEDTFTIPTDEFNSTSPSGCTKLMAGCTGEFVGLSHDVGGIVTVLDDCTFEISEWSFDGEGPAVEWWAAKQAGDPAVFPYPANAKKIGELGAPGSYQTGMNHGGAAEVVVRLGKDAAGAQTLLSTDFNHISLWCEDFAIDFGNVALDCSARAPLEAEAESPAAAPKAEGEPSAKGPAAEGEPAKEPLAEGEPAKAPKAEGEDPAEAPAETPTSTARTVPSTISAPAPEPEAGTTSDETSADESLDAATQDVVSGSAGVAKVMSVGAVVIGAAMMAL